jgi:hypothetical protein
MQSWPIPKYYIGNCLGILSRARSISIRLRDNRAEIRTMSLQHYNLLESSDYTYPLCCCSTSLSKRNVRNEKEEEAKVENETKIGEDTEEAIRGLNDKRRRI